MKIEIYKDQALIKSINTVVYASAELNQGLLVVSFNVGSISEFVQFDYEEFKLILFDNSSTILQAYNKVSFRRFSLREPIEENLGTLEFQVIEV